LSKDAEEYGEEDQPDGPDVEEFIEKREYIICLRWGEITRWGQVG
jgi:hypothetical protein